MFAPDLCCLDVIQTKTTGDFEGILYLQGGDFFKMLKKKNLWVFPRRKPETHSLEEDMTKCEVK